MPWLSNLALRDWNQVWMQCNANALHLQIHAQNMILTVSELEGDLSQCSSLVEESEADALSYSPIKVLCSNLPRLYWSHISCNWCFALLLLCCTPISLVYTSCMWIRPAYPFSVHIPSVIIPYLSIQMLFLCIGRSKGRGWLLIVEEHEQSIWKR